MILTTRLLEIKIVIKMEDLSIVIFFYIAGMYPFVQIEYASIWII